MNLCCSDFTRLGFTTHRKKDGRIAHTCYACKRDVSRQVLDLFFKDPWGTIKLKRKSNGGA